MIEIVDDGLLEDNEEFVVNLELNPESSAALEISSTVVLIMEDLMEDTGKYLLITQLENE